MMLGMQRWHKFWFLPWLANHSKVMVTVIKLYILLSKGYFYKTMEWYSSFFHIEAMQYCFIHTTFLCLSVCNFQIWVTCTNETTLQINPYDLWHEWQEYCIVGLCVKMKTSVPHLDKIAWYRSGPTSIKFYLKQLFISN